jgi:hypothetical protein
LVQAEQLTQVGQITTIATAYLHASVVIMALVVETAQVQRILTQVLETMAVQAVVVLNLPLQVQPMVVLEHQDRVLAAVRLVQTTPQAAEAGLQPLVLTIRAAIAARVVQVQPTQSLVLQ